MWDTLKSLNSRMLELFNRVAEEGENIIVDGMPGFNDRAQFVNGKVIHLGAYVVANLLTEPAEREEGIQKLRRIVAFTARMKMETWGMLNALEGLWLLHQRGLLQASVDADSMALLQEKLHWRDFVDAENDYALINKPTNYYGVAFGVARYRELLGWDEVGSSAILLDHLLQHISRYSGKLGYMDETPGYGRFDRYSILIPAEITAQVLATNWEEPKLIREMLGRSAGIVLRMATPDGTGFSYGRSIGAYGDTAALSILSTSAALGGVFHGDEERIAFGYCRCLLNTMVNFWYDVDMGSINMWEKGRRTDGYRNKHRILGENISLSLQIVEAIEQWESIGYDWTVEPEGWEKCLDEIPASTLTVFSEDPIPRALLQHRDGKTIWSLPLIGGGPDYFDKDPYLPVPRSNGLIEAVPDVRQGAWIPVLILKDGRKLIPAGRAEKIRLETTENGCVLQYRQSGAIQVGLSPLEPVDGFNVETTYTFAHGLVKREDEIRLSADLSEQTDHIQLICELRTGEVETTGYENETRQIYQEAAEDGICLDTPRGACREVVQYELSNPPGEKVVHVGWKFVYGI